MFAVITRKGSRPSASPAHSLHPRLFRSVVPLRGLRLQRLHGEKADGPSGRAAKNAGARCLINRYCGCTQEAADSALQRAVLGPGPKRQSRARPTLASDILEHAEAGRPGRADISVKSSSRVRAAMPQRASSNGSVFRARHRGIVVNSTKISGVAEGWRGHAAILNR
jgi:hypothetical protein